MYSLDRQWPTATASVKSSYFQFATIKLNFVRNEFSHTNGIHNIRVIKRGNYKIVLYAVVQSDVDGDKWR